MKLEFSGAPEITASRQLVWAKLMDPDFVAASAPGVESVEPADPTHFKVISGLGVGSVKVRFKLDVELFDMVPGHELKMRAQGKAPGSAVDVVSHLRLEDAGPEKIRLSWSATSLVSGTVAGVGARLLEGAARRLTEQFWTDFARRAGQGREGREAREGREGWEGR
jgi:carbon monoxide dehydrogenase subunit G